MRIAIYAGSFDPITRGHEDLIARSLGFVDRLILGSRTVLESTVAARTFEVDQKTRGEAPMVYAPAGQSGNFFSRQERNVRSLQVVEGLSVSREHWAGEHVFKVGIDFQHSRFDGDSYSQQVDVRRLDGSLAERTTYVPGLTHPEVSGNEFAVFAQDRAAVRQASAALRQSAGNFYVNDKPTGAVVGQQPFGGARGSGTNDKAGSKLNLVRWVSARAVKETFSPPLDYRYPFMAEE